MISIAIILYIHRVVTGKGKDKHKELSGYGYQGLHLYHASVQHLLVVFMHNPMGFHHIDGGEIQQLPHQGTTPLRDAAFASVFAGANFKKIKAGQFHHLRDRVKPRKIAHLPNETCNGDPPNTFDGEDTVAVRNLIQIVIHLLFQLINKTALMCYLQGKMGNLHTNALFAFLDPYGSLRGRSLRTRQGQGMPQGDHVSDHPGIFCICLIWRISCQLFHSFSMHGINLHQGYRFLSQIVEKRLSVGAGRFKANHYLFKTLFCFKLIESHPKGIKALFAIVKRE